MITVQFLVSTRTHTHTHEGRPVKATCGSDKWMAFDVLGIFLHKPGNHPLGDPVEHDCHKSGSVNISELRHKFLSMPWMFF